MLFTDLKSTHIFALSIYIMVYSTSLELAFNNLPLR